MILPDDLARIRLIALRLAIEPENLSWISQAVDWVETMLHRGASTPAMVDFSLDQYDDDFRRSVPERIREILWQLQMDTASTTDAASAWEEIARIYARKIVVANDPYPVFADWSNEPLHDLSYSNPITQIHVDFGWEYYSQSNPDDSPYSEPDRKRKTDQKLIAACNQLLRSLDH